MRSRLILVDQSIKQPGGHHYEYARRVLDAAHDRGLETMLLANREYKGTIPHEVRSTFTWTFWDNYRYFYGGSEPGRASRAIKAIRARADNARLGLKRRFIYSCFGLAAARARFLRFRDIVLRAHLESDDSTLPSGRLLLASMKVLQISYGALPRGRRFGFRWLRLPLLALAGAVVAPIVEVKRAMRRDPGVRFAKELSAALRGVQDLDRTVIFIPNATPAELHGVVALSKKHHRALRAEWAFLYRRPLFSGYPGGYARQMENVRSHRVDMARLKQAAPDLRVRFYTDTDELTEQYDLLGAARFTTLPVPVDIPREVTPPREGRAPLVVGYLGDARDEKGFQHLPGIVEAFAPRPPAQPQARFLFQANFNTPEGEPGSRFARSLLRSYDPSFVELAYGPFDADEYAELLGRMDIVLIPYAAENYAARSSGIYMEALSRGVPVVAPCCSWMARLAEPSRRRYLLSLFDGDGRGPKCVARLVTDLADINEQTLLVDHSADYVLLRMSPPERFRGCVRCTITSINEYDIAIETSRNAFSDVDGQVVAAFEKPPSVKLWCKIEPIDKEVHDFSPCQIDMSLFASSARIPLAAGVALFDAEDDLPTRVRDLVRFYDHHRRAAVLLRDELMPLYDPSVLVAQLFPAVRNEMVAAPQPAVTAA